MMIDFRSDTVTRPTPGMLDAMFRAEVGDDVFSEDPTVIELERYSSGLFGMEAGLFCPSGTMTNQLAIRCHTQPGDEIICDADSHVYQYEGGGIAVHSLSSVALINGNRGRITAEQVRERIQPEDIHRPHTSLVCLENTANRGGGSCYELHEMEAIREVCNERGLSLHLDGARLFNALVAKNQDASDFGRLFHSISICLSKGLGAPVGSVLLGSASFIKKARRWRKLFGGGMRQAGFLAAAGLYALHHHVDRLAIDHDHAQKLAALLMKMDWVQEVLPVETNIIIFRLHNQQAAAVAERLKQKGILCYAISASSIRFVVHLDISGQMIDQTMNIIQEFQP